MTVFADSALAYATTDGFYVLPLKPRAKVPLTAHGLEDATSDPLTIETWWARWPEANVGIRTGNIVVVDEDRLDALQHLADELGETIPPTRVARTGSGRHYYFTQPVGTRIRNSAGKLAQHIDTRGDGGYVVAPPSVHPDGGTYTWETDDPPAPMPHWIVRLLEAPVIERKPLAPLRVVGDTTPYGLRALEEETRAVATAAEGTRNHQLNIAAFALGQLVAGGELNEHDARHALEDAANACGLPQREATQTIQSGFTSGLNEPRRAPERPQLTSAPSPTTPTEIGVREIVSKPALEFQTLADLCAEVAAQGPREWLIRGIWPAGAYGVHAAEMKAQKTWNALDLAISVASGTDWLGTFPTGLQGPVLVFAGEGGKPSIVRRIQAICASKDVSAETLPIVVCARAPHLSDAQHLALVAAQIDVMRPVLVVLDPLYLAAGNAKGADLYAMAPVLESVQHLCEPVNAALFVVTHYNRKEGTGPLARITGAGPSEWGRVIIGARVISRHTDPETLASTVSIELDAIGGEIPDQALRIRREIQSENPDDLDAPLRYHVEPLPDDTDAENDSDLPPAARKLIEALKAQDRPATISELVDWIDQKHGHGLRRETCSRELNKLQEAGTVISYQEAGALPTAPKNWALASTVTAVTAVTSHVTSQQGEHGVTGVISPIGDHAVTSQQTITPRHDQAVGHTDDLAWLDTIAPNPDTQETQ